MSGKIQYVNYANNTKKILYEHHRNIAIFWVTEQGIYHEMPTINYLTGYLGNGTIIKIIEHSKNIVIDCYDKHIIYNSGTGILHMYHKLKHVEFNGLSYRFIKNKDGDCSLIIRDCNMDIVNNLTICGQEYDNNSVQKLLLDYLNNTGKAYDRNLVNYGTIIYRKFYDPILIGNRLHDLVVICRQ